LLIDCCVIASVIRYDEWLPVRSPRLRNVAIQHQALEQVRLVNCH
jgi:hypothetical protein